MQREQACHDGKCGSDDHRPRVAAPSADGGQADGGDDRNKGAGADRVDVRRPRERDVMPADGDVDGRRGSCGRHAGAEEEGEAPHMPLVGNVRRGV